MFVIKNGYAYLIKENKAIKVEFDENEVLIETKEELENIKGLPRYTYQEVYKKLNVRYNSALKKEELAKAKEKAKVDEKINKNKKSQAEKLDKE